MVGDGRVAGREKASLSAGKSWGRGVPLGVELSAAECVGVTGSVNLAAAVWKGVAPLAGEPEGVVCRRGELAEGEAGDSGRRKGELRGDPYPSGEGL